MQAYSQATETFECVECGSTSCMHYGPRMVHYHEPRPAVVVLAERSPRHNAATNRRLPPPGTPMPVRDFHVLGGTAHFVPFGRFRKPQSVPVVNEGWRLDLDHAMPVRMRPSTAHRGQNQAWAAVRCTGCGAGGEITCTQLRNGDRRRVCVCVNANLRPRRQALRGLELVR